MLKDRRLWPDYVDVQAALGLFISPEHKVLMVSYCGQSMCIVRRSPCGINNCFISLLLQLTQYLVGSIGLTCRSKLAKSVLIGNPR